jgi:hypothetical protein
MRSNGKASVSEDDRMKVDSGWLAILRASGGQSLAATGALGLFLWIARRGWIPPLAPWMIQLTALAMCIFAGLFAVSFLVALGRIAFAILEVLWAYYRSRKQRK